MSKIKTDRPASAASLSYYYSKSQSKHSSNTSSNTTSSNTTSSNTSGSGSTGGVCQDKVYAKTNENMSPRILEFCTSPSGGGAPFTDVGVLAKWLASKKVDMKALDSVIEAGITPGMLDDWRTFVCAIGSLAKDPLQRKGYGEKPVELFGVRRIIGIAAQLARATTSSATTSLAHLDFAAWCLWQTQRSRVYLYCDAVKSFCRKWGIDVTDMMAALQPHPSEPDFFTAPYLRKAELQIRELFDNAQCLLHQDNSANNSNNNDGDEYGDDEDANDRDDHGRDEGMNVSEVTEVTKIAEVTPTRTRVRLDTSQIEAITTALKEPVSCIVGGAGVGKTTTLATLVSKIPKQTEVFCMAFTHKARRCMAHKLAAAAGRHINVSTIHSFVAQCKKAQQDTNNNYMTNKSNKLLRVLGSGSNGTSMGHSPALIIIDEASMVDVELFAELAWAVLSSPCKPLQYQLCLVGDDGQLPPIGRGEIFRQIVEGKGLLTLQASVSRLTTCHRTEAVALFEACQGIRHGQLVPAPTTSTSTSTSTSWELHIVANDDAITNMVAETIASFCDEEYNAIQYIAWQNKDVRRINGWVQGELLQRAAIGPNGWRFGAITFYTGDRVIYGGDNQPDIDLSNSMTGIVVQAASSGMTVSWDNGASSALRSSSPLVKDISLAYCITVHKSQGSEYDVVVIPCFESFKMMNCLDRRWLYTAATRAKQRAIIIATAQLKKFVEQRVTPAPLCGL
jgi:AAA domain/UvrD-like helicase C-terminal domain